MRLTMLVVGLLHAVERRARSIHQAIDREVAMMHPDGPARVTTAPAREVDRSVQTLGDHRANLARAIERDELLIADMVRKYRSSPCCPTCGILNSSDEEAYNAITERNARRRSWLSQIDRKLARRAASQMDSVLPSATKGESV